MKLDRSDPDLETLMGRVNRGDLDLQPEFQRGEVWDIRRQQRLIDTILRGWYVPAVHIVLTDDGDEVLDGQQRLAAVRNFLRCDFKVDGFTEPHSDFIKSLDSATFEDLPSRVQRAILKFVIPVITLSDYEPGEPNELFFRLNQAYNLTPSEKRNALHGPARDEVRKLVTILTDEGLLDRSMIGFSNARLAYDDVISRACVAAENGDLRVHINNSTVEEFYRRDEGFDPAILHLIRRGAFTLLTEIINAGGRIKFNKGTLQTWLLFSAWAERNSVRVAPTLLGDFEIARASVRRGETSDLDPVVAAILALYDDRASYRVTDVSSVLIRDLCVHLFSQVQYGSPPFRRTDTLVEAVTDDPSGVRPIVSEFLDRSGWGENFLGAGPIREDD